MENLAEKLRSLGLNITFPTRAQESDTDSPSEIQLEEPSGQVDIHSGWKMLTFAYPSQHFHGYQKIHTGKPARIIMDYYGLDPFADEDLLFFDIETSGVVGGAGTLIFMAGMGYFSAGLFHVDQYVLLSPSAEVDFLSAINDQIKNEATVVSYNGKSFDVPVLKNRLVISGCSNLSPIKQMDLLFLARRMWRQKYPTLSLSFLETALFNFQRTEQDIPGALIPDMYLQFLYSGNNKLIDRILYHNRIDILSLAGLYCHINSLLGEGAREQILPKNVDWASISDIYSDQQDHPAAIELLRKSLRLDLSHNKRMDILFRLGMLHLRIKENISAVQYLEESASGKNIEAMIELSKYYEHKAKNIDNAFYWANQAYERFINEPLLKKTRNKLFLDVQKRYARLNSGLVGKKTIE